MSALKLVLENFETGEASGEADIATQQLKAAAYAEGFAAGSTAEAVKHQHDYAFFDATAAQLKDVLNALPEELNQQLGESLMAVLQKTLPALAEEGFAQETALAVLEHANNEEPGSVVVKVSQERAEGLKEAFAARGIEEIVTIEVDPELSGSTVTAFWKNGGLEMDIDKAAKKSLECLENFVRPTKEETSDE